MAQKQSILGRIGQLARANINALLDSAEDPQKMLDQMIRDYTNNIADAEDAAATTIGNLRMMQSDQAEDKRAAADWSAKAIAASQKADQLRASGQTADADKFDQLAKVALGRQLTAEKEVEAAQPQIDSQSQVVEQLKNGINSMKQKLDELKNRRDSLVARAKTADAQVQVNKALGNLDVLDPTSDLARFEDRVRRQEAQAMGQAELQASSLDSQFEQLTASADDIEIEARLAALKAGSQPAITQAEKPAIEAADDSDA